MKKLIGLLVLVLTSQSIAQISIFKPSEEDFNYPNYYQINTQATSGKINLMDIQLINQKFPLPAVPYNRDTHFGGWLVERTDGNCLNTRGKVLVRDSVATPTYTADGCFVATGTWNDPYTARTYTSTRDIQIDHVVALKNTYMTGGHEWDFNKRCLYANYMGNKFHLLSVDGPENLKKSDLTPAGYIPPNRNFTCQFVKIWLNIKLIWNLRITPKENEAIRSIATNNQCDPEMFKVSEQDYIEQQRIMQEQALLCATPNTQLMAF